MTDPTTAGPDYVLVPVEPTTKMHEEGWQQMGFPPERRDVNDIYRAMIAARPTIPTAVQGAVDAATRFADNYKPSGVVIAIPTVPDKRGETPEDVAEIEAQLRAAHREWVWAELGPKAADALARVARERDESFRDLNEANRECAEADERAKKAEAALASRPVQQTATAEQVEAAARVLAERDGFEWDRQDGEVRYKWRKDAELAINAALSVSAPAPASAGLREALVEAEKLLGEPRQVVTQPDPENDGKRYYRLYVSYPGNWVQRRDALLAHITVALKASE